MWKTDTGELGCLFSQELLDFDLDLKLKLDQVGVSWTDLVGFEPG